MRIGVVGTNYKSAPLEIREKLAKAYQYCFSPKALNPRLKKVILLSTCNRTEVYFSTEDLAETQRYIIAALREFVGDAFEQKLYSFFSSDCFLHLVKVAAGLDSAILAETEIQQQVRSAYRVSCDAYSLSSPLHFLFQKTLKISKEVRSGFPLPRGLPSLESVLFELLMQSGTALPPKVLFIGNSHINRQLLNFFQVRGGVEMTICTQNIGSAEGVIGDKNIDVVGREALSSWRNWDVVICATHQAGYLLRKDGQSLQKRHLLIDLSIPRLIDPVLGRDPMIHLLNMEEIATLVDGRRRRLMQEADAWEKFLTTSVEKYLELYQQKMARKCA